MLLGIFNSLVFAQIWGRKPILLETHDVKYYNLALACVRLSFMMREGQILNCDQRGPSTQDPKLFVGGWLCILSVLSALVLRRLSFSMI